MANTQNDGAINDDMLEILNGFAALRVTKSALEETLGLKFEQASKADVERMRRILTYMTEDKLTLGKAIQAEEKGGVTKKKPAAGTKSTTAKKTAKAKPQPSTETTKKPARTSAKASTKPAKSTAKASLPWDDGDESPSSEEKPEKLVAKKPARKAQPGKDNLLIVESPAKAKTIKKFLGGNFTVKASMGHVRDIPSRGNDRTDIGINFQNGYQPYYVPIERREKVLKDLSQAAEKAAHVYLAPDPDREGEAIAWHLKEVLELPDDKVSRVTFNAITKSAVKEAIEHPDKINMDRVNAQQGRRVLDRIVGYRLSPFLWKKVTKGLSAGRVQSVAVRLVAEREEEIRAFNTTEYWRIRADVHPDGSKKDNFQAELVRWKGEDFVLPGSDKKAPKAPTAPDEATAKAIADALSNVPFQVDDVTEREVKGRPSPPFITSSLQQAASNLLRLGAQRTMRIAQTLYEGAEIEGESTGLITYMRTDSTRVAPEAIEEVREYITTNFDKPYLPAKPNVYSSRKNAQDAHEAIRPTSVYLTPERVKPFITPDQFKLYDLIWRRFVASQLSPAEYRITTAKIRAGEGLFEAKGRRILFDGHTVLSLATAKKKKKEKEKEKEENQTDDSDGKERNDEEQLLPKLDKGQALELLEVLPTQHFTQPPVRFTEASLVRELEKEGIGRPSTYAPIVQTIQDKGYVGSESRRLFATQLGMAVTGILKDNFPDIMDVKFTAQMEADLDRVEEGEVDWSNLVDKFYKPFEVRYKDALDKAQALKGGPAPNGEKCPLCGSDMTIRYSQRGAFLGCSKYPDCKGKLQLPGEMGDGDGDDSELEGIECNKCGRPMAKKRSRFGAFLACTGYPECENTKPLSKDGKLVELPDIKLDCEKCGKPMVVKSSRRGPFLACSGYPECKNTKHLDKNGKVVELPVIEGEVCEKCGSAMVVRMGPRGPFLACSGYPKCRNAKPIPKSGENGDESGAAASDASASSEKKSVPSGEKG